MRRLRLATLCCAVASIGAIAACGNSEESSEGSDEEQIVSVIENYNTAVADSDGPAACALLTADAQAEAADDHGYGGTGGIEAPEQEPTCEDGITNRYTGEQGLFQKMKFATVDSVEVRGSEAQAKVRPEGFAPEKARLVLEGDTWKLSKPLPPIDQGEW